MFQSEQYRAEMAGKNPSEILTRLFSLRDPGRCDATGDRLVEQLTIMQLLGEQKEVDQIVGRCMRFFVENRDEIGEVAKDRFHGAFEALQVVERFGGREELRQLLRIIDELKVMNKNDRPFGWQNSLVCSIIDATISICERIGERETLGRVERAIQTNPDLREFVETWLHGKSRAMRLVRVFPRLNFMEYPRGLPGLIFRYASKPPRKRPVRKPMVRTLSR